MANWADDAAIAYPPNLAVGGETRGKEAIREWYRKDWEQFPQESFKVENVCVENIFAQGAQTLSPWNGLCLVKIEIMKNSLIVVFLLFISSKER